jgi:hypothetical protein
VTHVLSDPCNLAGRHISHWDGKPVIFDRPSLTPTHHRRRSAGVLEGWVGPGTKKEANVITPLKSDALAVQLQAINDMRKQTFVPPKVNNMAFGKFV